MPSLAVLDVETTGLSPNHSHRIVEIAILRLSMTGELEDEFTTLLNPVRDIGPTHVHGLTPSDIVDAPSFIDMGGAILEIFSGTKAVIGHNVSFDLRFLESELARIGAPMPEIPRIDTMRLAGGGSLAHCCDKYNIRMDGDFHSALYDVRMTAELFRRILKQAPFELDFINKLPLIDWPARPIRAIPAMPRRMPAAGIHSSAHEVIQIHELPRPERLQTGGGKNLAGLQVAFTGESKIYLRGRRLSRDEVEALAERQGLTVKGCVTKSLDFLVAADACTQSTKGRKARQYGIPILNETEFLQILGIKAS